MTFLCGSCTVQIDFAVNRARFQCKFLTFYILCHKSSFNNLATSFLSYVHNAIFPRGAMDCGLVQEIIHTSLLMLHWLSHFMKMPGIIYQTILEISLGMIIMALQQAEMIWWAYLHMWNMSYSEQSSTLIKLREGNILSVYEILRYKLQY